MTGEERRVAFFNTHGVYGKQLDLHMARIDRELVETQIPTGKKIKLIFDYQLPATLEEAVAKEEAARAALGLPTRDEKMRQLHQFMAQRGATFEQSRAREQASEPSPNPCTPVPSPHTPTHNLNLTPNPPSAPSDLSALHTSHLSHESHPSHNHPSHLAATVPTPLDSPLITPNSPLPPVPPTQEQMRLASEKYTLARAYEHIAYVNTQRYLPKNALGYETAYKECPCGSQLPCPWHEEFHPFFWHVGPFSVEYAQALRERGIPYREPEELLA